MKQFFFPMLLVLTAVGTSGNGQDRPARTVTHAVLEPSYLYAHPFCILRIERALRADQTRLLEERLWLYHLDLQRGLDGFHSFPLVLPPHSYSNQQRPVTNLVLGKGKTRHVRIHDDWQKTVSNARAQLPGNIHTNAITVSSNWDCGLRIRKSGDLFLLLTIATQRLQHRIGSLSDLKLHATLYERDLPAVNEYMFPRFAVSTSKQGTRSTTTGWLSTRLFMLGAAAFLEIREWEEESLSIPRLRYREQRRNDYVIRIVAVTDVLRGLLKRAALRYALENRTTRFPWLARARRLHGQQLALILDVAERYAGLARRRQAAFLLEQAQAWCREKHVPRNRFRKEKEKRKALSRMFP